MKKTIAIIAAAACIAQAQTLTNIVSGVDSFGTWITKINAGFSAAQPAGFTLYLTDAVPVEATENYAATTVKNWLASTLAQTVTVNTTNGTAQVLTAGIYSLNLTGTFTGTDTDTYTLAIYNGTNAISQTSQTFTDDTPTAFEIRWPASVSISNTLSVVVTGDSNRLAFLTNDCTVVAGGTTNTYTHAGEANSRAIYAIADDYPRLFAEDVTGTNRWNYATDSTTTVETVVSAVLWPWQAAWTSITVSATANTAPTLTDAQFWGVKH
jgi:hypothetical protein